MTHHQDPDEAASGSRGDMLMAMLCLIIVLMTQAIARARTPFGTPTQLRTPSAATSATDVATRRRSHDAHDLTVDFPSVRVWVLGERASHVAVTLEASGGSEVIGRASTGGGGRVGDVLVGATSDPSGPSIAFTFRIDDLEFDLDMARIVVTAGAFAEIDQARLISFSHEIRSISAGEPRLASAREAIDRLVTGTGAEPTGRMVLDPARLRDLRRAIRWTEGWCDVLPSRSFIESKLAPLEGVELGPSGWTGPSGPLIVSGTAESPEGYFILVAAGSPAPNTAIFEIAPAERAPNLGEENVTMLQP